MPELPDVEIFRKEVAEETVREKISSVSVPKERMLRGIKKGNFRKKLQGQKIIETLRHGKNLFLKLSSKEYLRMHFGMTGYLKYEDDVGKLPRHTSVALHFESGHRLDFIDPRMFGALEYVPDLEAFLKKAHIGPDVESLSQKEFLSLLEKKHGGLKVTLMDQSVMSGLGNVYTDEVLFQSHLSPLRKIETLTNKDLTSLFKNIKKVIRIAIKDHADREEMPGTWLINHRRAGEKCPNCEKGKIVMKEVGGRSTYFCERCQR